MLSIARPEHLLTVIGTDLGASSWKSVDQSRITLFADATDDHQWIHVDPERAATSPFGGTIAHGFLSLSLLSSFLDELLEVRQAEMLINYGLRDVRFAAPVPAGSMVRATGRIANASMRGSRVQLEVALAVEVSGSEKPACVASFLVLVA